jgi:hypothetical protein
VSVELDMRQSVVEKGRRSCGVGAAGLKQRLWRATEREAERSIGIEARGMAALAVKIDRRREDEYGCLSAACTGASGCSAVPQRRGALRW